MNFRMGALCLVLALISMVSAQSGNNCVLDIGHVEVRQSVPAKVAVGESYVNTITITAKAEVRNVYLDLLAPEGARHERSEPSASAKGNVLKWKVNSMSRGESKQIKVFLKAEKEGGLTCCATVRATPVCCASTFAGRAVLTVKKTGPATAQMNQRVNYQITITNTGTAEAKNIKIEDSVPEGLEVPGAPEKRSLVYSLTSLAPRASKSITVPLVAKKRGEHCNKVTVSASNAETVKDSACTKVELQALNLSLDCTKQQSVGQRATSEIKVKNPGDTKLTNVVLTSDCVGIVPVSAEGNPEGTGTRRVWRVGDLNPGEEKTYTVVFTTNIERETSCTVTVTSAQGLTERANCKTVWKGTPKLTITKDGPEKAIIGQVLTYRVIVKNEGTSTAENVVVQDKLPEGLQHASGQTLNYKLGNMPPGTSKVVNITGVKAAARGEHCNTAIAKGDNTEAVNAKACTKVFRQLIDLELDCPKITYLGKRSRNSVVLSNPGDTTLTNIVVTATFPKELNFVSAEGNPTAAGSQVVWRVPSLKSGDKLTYNVLTISKYRGNFCMKVSVNCDQRLTKTVECCTEWKGYPAILLEVIDTEDPLLVGEETDYVVKVTNQGTADDLNIRIIGTFPNEVSPLSTSGDTKGTITGKRVEFASYPILKPKQVITFRIRAKGVAIGDSRLLIEMYSDFLKTPVKEEESTHVY